MNSKKIVLGIMMIFMGFSSFAAGKSARKMGKGTVGAGENKQEKAEVIMTDMIGRQISVLPGSYKRVVCVGAGALRMYSYIGNVDLLCGVEDIDNISLSKRPKMFDSVARPYMIAYGDVFAKLDSCGVGGPNAQTAEAEKILMCNPDIVISEYEDKEKEDALQEQLGVPVVTLKSGKDGVFDENFKNSLRLLGKIFNEEAKAEKINGFIEEQTNELKKRTANVADKPKVYICGLGNWGTTNHLMTSEKYITFDICNIENVVTGVGKPGMFPIEKEKFEALGKDMDVIIIDGAAVKNIKPLYKEDPAMFDSCKAWKNGEVYLQMAYNAYYTNYELVLINAWFISKMVYPELFADVDMDNKTNEITKVFLGDEMAEKIYSFPASFGGYQKIDTAAFF